MWLCLLVWLVGWLVAPNKLPQQPTNNRIGRSAGVSSAVGQLARSVESVYVHVSVVCGFVLECLVPPCRRRHKVKNNQSNKAVVCAVQQPTRLSLFRFWFLLVLCFRGCWCRCFFGGFVCLGVLSLVGACACVGTRAIGTVCTTLTSVSAPLPRCWPSCDKRCVLVSVVVVAAGKQN